jgi:galactokinase
VPEIVAFAPGRVNLIGEHTDYNQGLALPFAVLEGVTVTATPRSDRRIEALALDEDDRDEFDLGAAAPGEGWRAFVHGAVGELQSAGIDLTGACLTISGTVPQGAGLSSSAALEVALTLALCAVAGAEPPDRRELAKLCSRIENDWVGAQTGLLDQLASLFGETDHALRIDFRTLGVEAVTLELGDYGLVTLDSGESHTHAGSGYNERRAECREAARRLGLESLRDATAEGAAELPDPLNRRVAHLVSENERVERTVAALARGDLDEVGRLLDASHASLRDDFEISTPAVEDAVARCKEAGAVGARIMGGGFGGNVLALLPPGADPPAGAIRVSPGPGAGLREGAGPG